MSREKGGLDNTDVQARSKHLTRCLFRRPVRDDALSLPISLQKVWAPIWPQPLREDGLDVPKFELQLTQDMRIDLGDLCELSRALLCPQLARAWWTAVRAKVAPDNTMAL